MNDHGYAIRVPADPAMAVTIRVFVAEAARQLGLEEPDVEDLRLLVTELLGNAIDTGGHHVEMRLDTVGDAWRLQALGVGSLDETAPIDRRAILSGLADLTWADGTVSLSAPNPG